MVLPGSQKPYGEFQADEAACRQNAQAAIGGQSAGDAAANAAVANALIGTAIGAAVGAIIGSATGTAGPAAAWGAGTGLLWGSASGANAAGWTYAEAQRRYDIAYTQCMYARGNQIPDAWRCARVRRHRRDGLSTAEHDGAEHSAAEHAGARLRADDARHTAHCGATHHAAVGRQCWRACGLWRAAGAGRAESR